MLISSGHKIRYSQLVWASYVLMVERGGVEGTVLKRAIEARLRAELTEHGSSEPFWRMRVTGMLGDAKMSALTHLAFTYALFGVRQRYPEFSHCFAQEVVADSDFMALNVDATSYCDPDLIKENSKC